MRKLFAIDPRPYVGSRPYRAWIGLGWLLRRAVCFAIGHHWPGPLSDAEAAQFGRRASDYGPSDWQRCYRCDSYRSRYVQQRLILDDIFGQWAIGEWTYGRGDLPSCGLPAVNPWRAAVDDLTRAVAALWRLIAQPSQAQAIRARGPASGHHLPPMQDPATERTCDGATLDACEPCGPSPATEGRR